MGLKKNINQTFWKVIMKTLTTTTLAAMLISLSLVMPTFANELYVDVSCSELQTNGAILSCGTLPLYSSTGDYTAGSVYWTPIFAGSAGNNSYQADAAAVADYGSLGVFAYAKATNVTFGDPDTRTMQLLAQASSGWSDSFTVSGASGTYVDIKVDLAVHISDLSRDENDGVFSAGMVYFSTFFSDYVGKWCWLEGAIGACGDAAVLGEGFTNISFTTQILAGTSSTWQSSLYAGAQVGNPSVGGSGTTYNVGSGMVNIEALNTARSYFTVLTPGATMEWASGHDYSVPAPATAIPEPETYSLLGIGLGLLGWIGRSRRGTATAAA